MDAVRVNNEHDLGVALSLLKEEIIVEGDLCDKVIRIKSISDDEWLLIIGSLTAAVTAAVTTAATAGLAAPLVLPATVTGMGSVIAVLGTTATISAVSIGVGGGSVGTLSNLRSYQMEIFDDYIILKKIIALLTPW